MDQDTKIATVRTHHRLNAQQQQYVLDNRQLVGWVINRWFRFQSEMTVGELESVGFEALCRCAASFDPAHPCAASFDSAHPFPSTYPVVCIRGGIINALKKCRKRSAPLRELTVDPAGKHGPVGAQLEAVDLITRVRRLLRRKEFELILRHYGYDETLQALGQRYGGVTKERIRQRIQKTVLRVRRALPEYVSA